MKIGQKSKDLLEFLFLTGIDSLASSTRVHTCFRSYGGWENNSSYMRHMRRMRERGLIDWQEDSPRQSWVPLLTEKGNDHFAESIDPRPKWETQWDNQWRSITFDLPCDERRERKRLDNWLKKQRFGHLQGSLWLSPLPYENWTSELGKLNIDPKSVIFMEGRPIGNLDDSTIVSSCWSFARLSDLHTTYLNYLDRTPQNDLEQLPTWLRQESQLWRACMEVDPLLPYELHPTNYMGPRCWQKRLQAYTNWRELLNL